MRLGIGRTTLYELIRHHELRTLKIGTRTLVPVSDLVALVERKLQEAA